jgi:lipid-A-disaccharide synthase-like uncharacterized protein
MNAALIALPYTAVGFSIIARFIFMYLLYTKKSTNIYSLTFCYLSVISSSLWIPYGIIIQDTPIIIRSSIEILLLSVSAVYITINRRNMSVGTVVTINPIGIGLERS